MDEDEQLKKVIAREVHRIVSQSDINIVNGRFVREAVEDKFQLIRGNLKQSHLKQAFKEALDAAVNKALERKPSSKQANPKRSTKQIAEASEETIKLGKRKRSLDEKEESEEIVNDASSEEESCRDSIRTADPIKPTELLPPNKVVRNGKKGGRVPLEQSKEIEHEDSEPFNEENTKVLAKIPTESKTENDLLRNAEIARLKSLVRQCGVHKQWPKELASLSTSKAQIRHLKEILHDLGMDGKLTSKKAKAIKEAREFERDIQDTQKDANDFIARHDKRLAVDYSFLQDDDLSD